MYICSGCNLGNRQVRRPLGKTLARLKAVLDLVGFALSDEM